VRSLGIDPGKDGAFALTVNGQLEKTWRMPSSAGELAMCEIIKIIGEASPTVITLEKVSGHPGMALKATWGFAQNYGEVRGLIRLWCERHQIRFLQPTPQNWQKILHKFATSTSKDPKIKTQQAVSALFPAEVALLKNKKDGFHSGLCDAVGIALYGERYGK